MQFNDVSPRRKTTFMECIQKINCKNENWKYFQMKEKHLMQHGRHDLYIAKLKLLYFLVKFETISV
jgi:hypothetical protein